MSLGLGLSGKYPVSGLFTKGPSPSEWLGAFQEWIQKREGDDLAGCHVVEGPEGDVLLVQLHPFAEAVQVTCPDTGRVALTAATESCGPGYHQHVAKLADAMASELKVSWMSQDAEGDDTGYFATGDPGRLEAAFLDALAELARAVPERGGSVAAPNLLLPPTHAGFIHDLAVSTPMGPRDADWLERARLGNARAADAFPWPLDATRAEVRRRRALALAWSEVRWREPADEAEEIAQAEVLRCLAAALAEGAKDLPWREWVELHELAEAEGDLPAAVTAAAREAKGPLVGYRRRDVVARLPGDFRMRLPGAFSEEQDEDGTWHGSDGERSVYVTAGRLPPVADMPGDAVKALMRTTFEGEPFELRGDRIAGRAALRRDTDDDGRELWVLACGAAQESFLVRATLTFESDADKEWALSCFRSIERGGTTGVTGGGIAGITSIG